MDEIEFLIQIGKLGKFTKNSKIKNNNMRDYEDRRRDYDYRNKNPQP